MALVASIRHGRITSEYNDGARCLRDYLRYAEAASAGDVAAARRLLADLHGRRDAAAEAGESDAVVAQLAAALRERGT